MLYIVLFLHQTATASHGLSAPCQLYIVLFLHQTATDRTVASNYLMLYIVLFLHQTATLLGVLLVGVQLYIVLFLHQTATARYEGHGVPRLYIVLFLHQTATLLHPGCCISCCISFYSYIKPQPNPTSPEVVRGCISFYSYIKPQLQPSLEMLFAVVYRSIPTSNRNLYKGDEKTRELYIVLFLHQTATQRSRTKSSRRCISFYSYIKPQLH